MMTPQQLLQLQRLAKGLRKQLFRHSQQSEIGSYRSKFKGSGLQFREHQVYEPGDDVRFIDWKITARLNRPYIKTFEEERLVNLHVIVDASSTMMMGEGSISKAQAALQLSVLLAMAAQQNKDKMMISWVGNEVHQTPMLKGQSIIPHGLDVAAKSGVLKNLGQGGLERKKETAQQVMQGKTSGLNWMPGFKRPLWGAVVGHELVTREGMLPALQKVLREGMLKKREVILISDFYQLELADLQLFIDRKNFHPVRLVTGFDDLAPVPLGYYSPLGPGAAAPWIQRTVPEQTVWLESLKHPKIITCDLRTDYLKNFLSHF